MEQEGRALFQGDITINDGQFTNYNYTHQHEGQSNYPASYSGRHMQYSHPYNVHEPGAGISALKDHISPRAFATQQEGEAPKCHPNTRMAVLHEIMTWILLTAADRIAWFMWVFGPAGAGKSAIARSIVERCRDHADIIITRFFFFRADGTRNTLDTLVSTIAYQLMQSLPELDAIILAKLRSHPRIFDDSLEEQLRMLIYEPLLHIHRISPITKAIVILLDGVDECGNSVKQRMLIGTLHQIFSSRLVPVILLFFSRPEVEIKAEFQSRKMASLTKHLELDHDYEPDEDIQRYLDDSFRDIKENHPFRHLIPENWPSPEAIDEIVRKSSGQFIFASVAVNYISAARFNPLQMLEIILGIQQPGNLTPFAQLDALYRHILSQVADIDRALLILATVIVSNHGERSLERCAKIHDISVGDIEVALADLTSVVSCRYGTVMFFHASLADFLLDKDRSGAFYIDRNIWTTRLCQTCLGQPGWEITVPPRLAKWEINDYITVTEPSAELRQAVLRARYDIQDYNENEALEFLINLKELDFGDGEETYLQMCDYFITEAASNDPKRLETFTLFSPDGPNMSVHSTRQFIINSFAEIKLTHQFNFLLPDNWPDEAAVDDIIANSERMFLYVYVAMQEIASPRRHPALQLEALRSVRAPTGDLSEQAPLDALYRHMLSQVFDLRSTLVLLQHNKFWPMKSFPMSDLMELHDVTFDGVQSSMAELTSVLSCHDHRIEILRESFGLFIWDYIGLPSGEDTIREWANRLSIIYLSKEVRPDAWTINEYLKLATPTPELLQAIRNAHHDLRRDGRDSAKDMCDYLRQLRRLDSGDDGPGELYYQKLDYFIRWAHANRPLSELKIFYNEIDDSSDILDSMGVDYTSWTFSFLDSSDMVFEFEPAPTIAITQTMEPDRDSKK